MNFFHTHVSRQASALVSATLQSTFISEGKQVKAFEDRLAAELGLAHPVTVNSGTTALHLGLVLAGVGPGDEVILPAQTFVATGLVILQQGAKPVFADIQPETGNLDPLSVRAKITPRTRAIMPVHWAGYPCDMDEIGAIAKEYQLAVIEDAAHALGAVYKGRPVGALSRFTAFSFQAIKHLTTGDGGALCCLDDKDAHQGRVRRWFGIDRANSTGSILGERVYDISALGFKYHMNDFAASLGLANLNDFPANLARHHALGERYRAAFKDLPGLRLLQYRDDRSSAYWLFTVLVERREDFIRKLQSHGIPSSVVHLRIDHNSVFGGLTPNLPGQEYFNDHQVAIPLHAGLTDDDAQLIIQTVRSGW